MYRLILATVFFFIGFSVSFSEIRVSPAEGYDFGLITIDTQTSFTFEIKNVGNSKAYICSIKVLSGAFSINNDNCSGKSLDFQHSCNFSVAFLPVKKEKYESYIEILYDDNGNEKVCDEVNVYRLPIKGIGTNLRIVKILPEPVESGSYFSLGEITLGESKTLTFRICNAGGESILIKGVKVVNMNSTIFGIDYSTCDNAYLIYNPNNETCEVNYCEFAVRADASLLSNVSNKIVQAYVEINDLNAGPGNTPSGYKVFLSSRVNLPTESMRAPVGGEDVQLIKIDFFCPRDADETPGEIMPIGQPSYTVVGSYFYIDEQNSSCPAECIEGQIHVCNILLKFKPEAPGVYEGKIIVSLPIREVGLFGKEYVVQKNVVGIAGDIDVNYLAFYPDKLSFIPVHRLSVQENVLNIKNTSSSTIPFDVYTIGAGFGITKISCDCNDKYFYENGFCIPISQVAGVSPDTVTASPHPYIIKPGKTCSIFVYFFKPLSISADNLLGSLIIDTPLSSFQVPLEAKSPTESQTPVYTPPPNIDVGGGGGCNAYNFNLLGIISIVFITLKVFRKIFI